MNEGICWSAYLKNIEEVKERLESGSDIEEKDRDGRTPLLNSVSGSNISIELVSLLINCGANTNAQDNAGFSALHFCAQEKQPEIAELLIDNGANVNLKDQWGNTPLFRAFGNTEKNIALIDILISNGCDPYSKNNSGVSAMDHALRLKTHPNHQIFKEYHENNS
ncbi:MAG: ankyrin repeat domain-containing protein [Candidatus Thiodiazotropha sp. (ex Myrtea sp. 'scaly one' KF741663)]|nr:ankyrin repeat domain-containing protein [Candidatus Thiodiazotropha sp. (ex Myrtea sp. 'scaly one' KF741663)]